MSHERRILYALTTNLILIYPTLSYPWTDADSTKAIKTAHTKTHLSFGGESKDEEGKNNHFQSTYLSDFQPITSVQCKDHSTTPTAGEIDPRVKSCLNLCCDAGNYFETEAQRSQSIVMTNVKGT